MKHVMAQCTTREGGETLAGFLALCKLCDFVNLILQALRQRDFDNLVICRLQGGLLMGWP